MGRMPSGAEAQADSWRFSRHGQGRALTKVTPNLLPYSANLISTLRLDRIFSGAVARRRDPRTMGSAGAVGRGVRLRLRIRSAAEPDWIEERPGCCRAPNVVRAGWAQRDARFVAPG